MKEIEGYSDKKGYKQDELRSRKTFFNVIIQNYPFVESQYKPSMALIPYMPLRALSRTY